MAKYIVCLITGYLLCRSTLAQQKPANGRSNENYVWLFNQKGKLERLFPLLTPVYENKNGMVNISVASDSNELFQVNGIPEKWLRDTVIKTTRVQVLLIRSDGKYVSSNRAVKEIHISCKSNKPGNAIRVRVLSTILRNKGSYRTEAQFLGKVPAKQIVHIQ